MRGWDRIGGKLRMGFKGGYTVMKNVKVYKGKNEEG